MSYTLFVHSHIFRRINNKFYSTGGLSNEVLGRYTSIYGKMVVLARIKDEYKTNRNYSIISNKLIEIIDYRSLKKSELRELVKRANLVILRLPCFISCKIYKYSKHNKITTVSEVVGCAFDSLWNHSIKGKIIAPYYYIKMRRVVRGSTGAIYVTNSFLQRRYPTGGISASCSDVNIVIDKKIQKKKNNHYSSINNNKTINLGTCAAINVKYKGQKYVIKAIAKLNNNENRHKYKYYLAGSGDNSRLKKIANKYGVAEDIVFLGNIPHEKINDYFDRLDIYVQPSNVEGLCRALLEAMSRACPCIASNAGGNPELINKKYIFKKKNINDLCEKIVLLSNTKEAKNESRNNFYESIKYSAENLSKIRNSFYEKFIEREKHEK